MSDETITLSVTPRQLEILISGARMASSEAHTRAAFLPADLKASMNQLSREATVVLEMLLDKRPAS
jgi:hypothetical protein